MQSSTTNIALNLAGKPEGFRLKRGIVSPSSGIVNDTNYAWDVSIYTSNIVDPAADVAAQNQGVGDLILWCGFTKGIGFGAFNNLVDIATTSYPKFKYAYVYDEVFLAPGGQIIIGYQEPEILAAADYARSKGLGTVITILPDVILDPTFALTSINSYSIISIDVYPSGGVTNNTYGCTFNGNSLSDLLYCSVNKLRALGFTGEIWYIYQAFGLHSQDQATLTAGFWKQRETLGNAQLMGITGIIPFGMYLGPEEIGREPNLFQGAGSVYQPLLNY